MFMPHSFQMFGQNLLDLFSNGEDGFIYAPWDLSTLWQDTSATTPVTGHGDTVQRVDDLSGNGRHQLLLAGSGITYGTNGTLHWLDFDGASCLQTASVVPSITDGGGAMVVAAASDQTEAVQVLLEEVASTGSPGARNALYFETRSDPKRVFVYAPDDTNRFVDLDAEIDGGAKILMFSSDGSDGQGYLNNSQQGLSVSTSATFAEDTLITLGRQTAGPVYHDGRIYGVVGLDRGLTNSERDMVQRILATRAGL